MTTGIRGDHMARLQAQLKSYGDRLYELERRLRVKQNALRPTKAEAVPHARLGNATSAVIAHGTETPVSFGVVSEQTVSGMVAGNRLVCPKTGIYTISCGLKWDFQILLGEIILHVHNPANGFVFIDDHVTFPVPLFISENTNHGTWTGELTTGTQLEVRAYQRNSDSASRSIVAFGTYPYFSLTYQGGT